MRSHTLSACSTQGAVLPPPPPKLLSQMQSTLMRPKYIYLDRDVWTNMQVNLYVCRHKHGQQARHEPAARLQNPLAAAGACRIFHREYRSISLMSFPEKCHRPVNRICLWKCSISTSACFSWVFVLDGRDEAQSADQRKTRVDCCPCMLSRLWGK